MDKKIKIKGRSESKREEERERKRAQLKKRRDERVTKVRAIHTTRESIPAEKPGANDMPDPLSMGPFGNSPTVSKN